MNLVKHTFQNMEVVEVPGEKGHGGVLLFHGFGADAYDLLSLSQMQLGEMKPSWFFPNGPLSIQIAPGYFGRAWFPIDFDVLEKVRYENNFDCLVDAFPKELTTIQSSISQMIKDLEIPSHQLFIGGFSQGAVLATEIALSNPENMAGLIVLSGTLIREKHWEQLTHLHHGLPFFQTHGKNDPLLPYSLAEKLEHLFIKGGLKGRLHGFSGGHEIPQVSLNHLQHFLKTHLG